jgi:small subunit ribosomal protein S8
MITDPISDMLTRIRNASAVRKAEVVLPFSNVKLAIAKILKEEGYIVDFNKENDGISGLKLKLKYNNNQPAIISIKRISKPGCRIYTSVVDLPRVVGGKGLAVISTSQGIMTNKEARKRKLGGEIICEIF